MLKEAILITGGGRRIGRHLVEQFLEQATHPVVFTYRTPRPEVETLQARGAVGIQVDFNQVDAVERVVSAVQSQVSSLRALIHNASVWSDDQTVARNPHCLTDMTRLHIEVPYRLNVALHELLLASQSPMKDVIALTDASVDGANGDYAAYLASKAGLQNLSKNFAKKWAPQIKVNNIAPGLILFHPEDDEAYRKRRLQQSALAIEPGEAVIWQAVQYLMESSYTTGITLPVEGGRHLM
ncbi:dihydromonapterin reductase [Thiomicrorhabdus sp. zzn3]|uniref:dihydromonapterin reductase n=1 Tax=Thiomicrorhabdus sp. zzn3 TaxID=3039775 RepID=UPI002437173E|nr:dihydromonapterin reductase [Thiomicrorhabdus sp. zzn3]MDG6777174.1 dihydromonapterin reductase [Thiomicrorhabdus sp. zzn3]